MTYDEIRSSLSTRHQPVFDRVMTKLQKFEQEKWSDYVQAMIPWLVKLSTRASAKAIKPIILAVIQAIESGVVWKNQNTTTQNISTWNIASWSTGTAVGMATMKSIYDKQIDEIQNKLDEWLRFSYIKDADFFPTLDTLKNQINNTYGTWSSIERYDLFTRIVWIYEKIYTHKQTTDQSIDAKLWFYVALKKEYEVYLTTTSIPSQQETIKKKIWDLELLIISSENQKQNNQIANELKKWIFIDAYSVSNKKSKIYYLQKWMYNITWNFPSRGNYTVKLYRENLSWSYDLIMNSFWWRQESEFFTVREEWNYFFLVEGKEWVDDVEVAEDVNTKNNTIRSFCCVDDAEVLEDVYWHFIVELQ